MIAARGRNGWGSSDVAVLFADVDEEAPLGYTPMRNADFLLHVRRLAVKGSGGPFRRPLVKCNDSGRFARPGERG